MLTFVALCLSIGYQNRKEHIFSSLEIHFLFFYNDFREGSYPLCCGRGSSPLSCERQPARESKEDLLMEIIIGSIPPLPPQNRKPPPTAGLTISAQLLHVRPPRKGIAGPSGRERRSKSANDPRAGRVLTIMVADGSQLPPDIDSGCYDVSIRLIRR
jgi:hypothetical protein